ncbi:MAG: DNA lyase [Planctomycetota bacterium]|nr:MAG: DNA lyase [Planctomycetota bacterium]
MRLWSLHPRYLDPRGLVALWREGLLARAVLLEQTRGYRKHPQLLRFRSQPDPVAAIEAYLGAVLREADARGYHFDRRKITAVGDVPAIPVTSGQLDYEWKHLLAKLRVRDPGRYRELQPLRTPLPHPLMSVVPGPIEPWEAVR